MSDESMTPRPGSRRWRRSWWKRGSLIPSVVDEVIEHYETNVGPLNGAKVVARAWTDPGFRERLLADGTEPWRSSALAAPRGT